MIDPLVERVGNARVTGQADDDGPKEEDECDDRRPNPDPLDQCAHRRLGRFGFELPRPFASDFLFLSKSKHQPIPTGTQ